MNAPSPHKLPASLKAENRAQRLMPCKATGLALLPGQIWPVRIPAAERSVMARYGHTHPVATERA
jgi:hypothetical protein